MIEGGLEVPNMKLYKQGKVKEAFARKTRASVTEEVFCLTQETIRQLQLAKAAVRTGVEFLLQQAQIKEPIPVYLAGGMGLVTERACLSLGMLPEQFKGYCRFLGNTALAGAVKLALKEITPEELKCLADTITEYELAEWEEFNQRFIDYINFPDK